jgi:hypothetical protein
LFLKFAASDLTLISTELLTGNQLSNTNPGSVTNFTNLPQELRLLLFEETFRRHRQISELSSSNIIA